MHIAIVGTGYVGLVTGVCLAKLGHDVVCVDIDADRVKLLQDGKVPFYEPDLEPLMRAQLDAKRLAFTTSLDAAVGPSPVVFIAVGTPEGENGKADLSYVIDAALAIGRSMRQHTTVVTKSTVPVGSSKLVAKALGMHATASFEVASNPEFLREGHAVRDFLEPDRVLIGADSDRAWRTLADVYVDVDTIVVRTDVASAELAKYAANAMLATRISFMNDIAALCEKVGADVESVRRAIGMDKRIGSEFLSAGIGYGGSCFPKDVKALVATANENGLPFRLLSEVEAVNAGQKVLLAEKAARHFGPSFTGRTFTVWGLAFKPRTDDMREAPSLALIEALLARGATVAVFDPVARRTAKRLLGQRVTWPDTQYASLTGSDALFIATEWNEFKNADLEHVKLVMKTPVIFDGRNCFEPGFMKALGFTYYAVGRR